MLTTQIKFLSCALLSVILTGCQLSVRNIAVEEIVTISREGSFTLDMSPDRALPLFTAPGETLWVPHWQPVILHGNGTEPGTVFITHNHGTTTYWLVNQYNPITGQANYNRITPEWDIGTVDIKVRAEGDGGSRVFVRYQLTSLSPQGADKLKETFDEPHYHAMMKEWQGLIVMNKEAIDEGLESIQISISTTEE